VKILTYIIANIVIAIFTNGHFFKKQCDNYAFNHSDDDSNTSGNVAKYPRQKRPSSRCAQKFDNMDQEQAMINLISASPDIISAHRYRKSPK
jgi:hypothetical protein